MFMLIHIRAQPSVGTLSLLDIIKQDCVSSLIDEAALAEVW
jgi:hypothetical protein